MEYRTYSVLNLPDDYIKDIRMSKIAITLLAITMPLALIGPFLGVIGGVWLMVLGEWSDVLWAIGAAVLAQYLISFILMIPIAIMLPADFLIKKGSIGKVLGYPFLLLSSISTWLIAGLWGLFLFDTALSFVGDNSDMPYLLIAYGMSVGTWVVMASAEDDSEQYSLLLIATRLSSIFLLIALGLMSMPFLKMITIYSAIFIVGFALQIVLGLVELRHIK